MFHVLSSTLYNIMADALVNESDGSLPDSAVDLPERSQSSAKEDSLDLTATKTATSDDYVLTRDVAASARLNLSHYIWLDAFGYNLHPRIRNAIRGEDDICVADVGTGTG